MTVGHLAILLLLAGVGFFSLTLLSIVGVVTSQYVLAGVSFILFLICSLFGLIAWQER